MDVGFIGLGIMGASMASNLQAAGHALRVHDIRRQAAARHLAAGAAWKDTPRAVAEAADVVFLSLPGPAEVEAVALGPTPHPRHEKGWRCSTCPPTRPR
jgi:3-hydroxyisobutyrate dehydrogenase